MERRNRIFSVASALQLYTEGRRYDHPIIKLAKVVSYPTLIVLDKEGRIVGIPLILTLILEVLKSI
jgi:hypothetical protein